LEAFMASHSPSTIPGVREQLARDPVPRDLATEETLMPPPVVRVGRMVAAAAVSTGAFIATSTTSFVNQALTVQSNSGLELLVTELFWLAAAAMGASFAMLLQASGYVGRGSDERGYWIQFFLSVMAGFIVVALLPAGGLEGVTGLSQPAIAVLGAFFASMVFRFLPGGRTPPPGNGGGHATQEP
jgi:hypothetical protein